MVHPSCCRFGDNFKDYSLSWNKLFAFYYVYFFIFKKINQDTAKNETNTNQILTTGFFK